MLLHEGLGSIAMWRDFPSRLAHATGCNILVYSRFGYGNSDPLTRDADVRYLHDEALIALAPAARHSSVSSGPFWSGTAMAGRLH